jgi:pilus assembly protein CpaE
VSVNLLLVGSTDRQLEEALKSCGMVAPSLAGSELASLAQPGVTQPDILVLDLRDQAHLPAALPLLKRQHPTTGVLIVASRMDPALLLEAMRAGVNEVVTDPVNVTELGAAIARLKAQRPVTNSPVGLVFAFVGAKGGVGTTTVAVNTATALAKLEPKRTLLIDLHLANGDAAVFLGAEGRFSIVDVLENTHRLDESYLRGQLVNTPSGVDLVCSSDRVMVAPVDVRRIRTLIDFAVRHYQYVILDVPRSDSATLDALELVTRIVVVANQELATVRSASRMAATLRHRYGAEKVSVIMGRSDRLAEIGQDDVERAVGAPVRHTFPSDYRRALQALNTGKPVTLENHNELSASFVTFARSLAGVEKKAQTPRPSLFGRFGKRAVQEESKS